MRQLVFPCLLGLSALLWSWPTHAAESYLSCQVELKQQSCTTVSSPWPASQPLEVAASCTECSGGGSDISCSPAELLSPALLVLETTSGAAVDGSFSQIGTCEFGVPLFRFGGSLAAASQYNLVATIPGHDKTLLLAFSTSGGTSPGGDGSLPGGDAAAGRFDGTVGTNDGGGSTAGDGDEPSDADGGSDGGCSCQLPRGESPLPSLLLALAALLLLRKRRPSARNQD